ncbi:NirA family protein [Paludisphaera borealis]|uniref:Sulfite reductase n=1 Tax=Paludisphaera borealis TaxID=1387353 RepID=A0A1U7CL45_9BACT|nr:NirA family protein [Paludisphaera borealis]APW59603.1 Sulfite reductase [Paludisphaera borealis]
MDPNEFLDDQKQYLQGFMSGAQFARAGRGLATFEQVLGLSKAATSTPTPKPDGTTGPEELHWNAQRRVIDEGKTLTPQEQAKRVRHPLDMWDDLARHAAESRFPRGDDVLAFKYHGLFYVSPAQNAYMCRLRLAGGFVDSHQFRGIARIADDWGGGYADATTRANLQIREIKAADGPKVVTALEDLGVVTRGSGADNIRNVTGSPTAGIDPSELIDTRPFCREMHHYILHNRWLYGLPRKFNIAFDGGGAVSALEDTNDIGFTAVRVGEGQAAPAGVYFRLMLGGISGHRDFALDEGVLLTPDQCIPVAAAILRVFIEHGDRTDRKKARLKYLLDRWGHEKFVETVETLLPSRLTRFPLEQCQPRPAVDKHGHIGVHAQKQPGRFYVGVVLTVGRMTTDQMRGLAAIADRYGSGTIRLTVWQNLLISDVAEADLPAVRSAIEDLGLGWKAGPVRGGLIACTGNAGCRFAASDTKSHALAIADHLDPRITMNQPVNIHLTGCPNSCAQHYIGDIGLLGAGVEVGDDVVEGYHVFLGGGYGDERGVGREVLRSVPATDVPMVVERLLQTYQERRSSPDESFDGFVRRHPTEQLKAWFERRDPASS